MPTLKHVSYRHFRICAEGKMRHHGGVTLAIGEYFDDSYQVAAAVCSSIEMYCHKRGREIALQRLWSGGLTRKGEFDSMHIPLSNFKRKPNNGELLAVAIMARAFVNSRLGAKPVGMLVERQHPYVGYEWAA